jgi:hypothetical protein
VIQRKLTTSERTTRSTWYPIETCNEYTGIMIWIGRMPRRNKIRLQYKRIQRMHSPPTKGATDMHWMSHQTEKYKHLHQMFPPEKDVRVRIGNPL